jgi:hypothetical protein
VNEIFKWYVIINKKELLDLRKNNLVEIRKVSPVSPNPRNAQN